MCVWRRDKEGVYRLEVRRVSFVERVGMEEVGWEDEEG